MRVCSTVAEYNPLHAGHLKHIEYMKNTLGAEKIIVIMSGDFTQRGEPAVLNKFTRAKHAVIAGADIVIELPTVFAVSNAEIFAKGAINIIDALNIADGLCFGAESGNKEDFLALASAMNNESKEFRKLLKANLEKGVSLAKARFETVKALYGGSLDESLISSPNNILGLEYTKALLKNKSRTEIFPMFREGDHNDTALKKGITSAASIRQFIKAARIKKLKKYLPAYVYKDLKDYPYSFDKITMSALVTATAESMRASPDCTEGLENRIKALSKDNRTVDDLVERATTKRYTSARIRRILTANLLRIKKDFTEDCLASPLYAKVLAANADSKDLLAEICQKSSIPVLTRKSDAAELRKTAAECFELDALANDLYNLAAGENNNENYILFI